MSEDSDDTGEEIEPDSGADLDADLDGMGGGIDFGDDDETEDEDAKPPAKSKKKLFAIIAAAVFVVLGAAGGTTYFLGLLDPILGTASGKKSAMLELGAPIIHDMPEVKADLKTGRCRAPFLRVVFAVQLNSGDLGRLQEAETKILDGVRVHLRDQERQDLVGKEGANRLRTDLSNIVNNAIAPARIQAVFFKEFLLQ